MKVDENRFGRFACRQQRAHFIAEAKRISKEQRSIEAQDLQALNWARLGGELDYAVGMFPARHGIDSRNGQVAGAPIVPKQREPYCYSQPKQYPDSNNAEQGQHGLSELAHLKLIKALQFVDLHHPRHCVDDDRC